MRKLFDWRAARPTGMSADANDRRGVRDDIPSAGENRARSGPAGPTTEGPRTTGAARLFYSYAHEDERLQSELAAHLAPVERDGLIEVWHDRKMLAGELVEEAIEQKLRNSQLILLLLSPDYLASSFCCDKELPQAIGLAQAGQARIVPVILRACQWQQTAVGRYVAVPTDGIPVTEWPNRDAVLNQVATEIRRLALELRREKGPTGRPEVAASFATGSDKQRARAAAPSQSAGLRSALLELVEIIDELRSDRDVGLASDQLTRWKQRFNPAVRDALGMQDDRRGIDLYQIYPDAEQRTPYNKLMNELRKCQKYLIDILDGGGG